MDWHVKFIRPSFIDENIRMADQEDIIPMKFNTFLCSAGFARYERKDYIDLATLLKGIGLDRMIDLYIEKYPREVMSSRILIEGLQLHEMADKKVMPKMLNGDTWESVKKQIERSIDQYVHGKIKKKGTKP